MPVPVTRSNQAEPLLIIPCISPISEKLISTQKNAYLLLRSEAAPRLSRNADELIACGILKRWRRQASMEEVIGLPRRRVRFGTKGTLLSDSRGKWAP
jgi:hypothetical protein